MDKKLTKCVFPRFLYKTLFIALFSLVANTAHAEYYFVTDYNESCVPRKFKYGYVKKVKKHYRKHHRKSYYHIETRCNTCPYLYKESYQGDYNPDMRTADDISIFPNLDIDD